MTGYKLGFLGSLRKLGINGRVLLNSKYYMFEFHMVLLEQHFVFLSVVKLFKREMNWWPYSLWALLIGSFEPYVSPCY